jgi:Spy/CpxP family protein refolding chaperone
MTKAFSSGWILVATLPFILGAAGTPAPNTTPPTGSGSPSGAVKPRAEQPMAGKAAAEATRPRRLRTPLPPGARAARLAWWNHPDIVEAIGVRADQKGEMDRVMSRHVEGHMAAAEKRQKLGATFQDALKSGEWDAARKHASELRDAIAQGWYNQALLKIEILQVLTKEQREKLAAEHSDLLIRPWMNPGMQRTFQHPGPRGNVRRTPAPAVTPAVEGAK